MTESLYRVDCKLQADADDYFYESIKIWSCLKK